MKKKILVISLAIALLAIALIGGTLAWFTDEEEATNTFTVGNVSIQLREPAWNGIAFDQDWSDVAADPTRNPQLGVDEAYNLVPGRLIHKDPQVMNDGANTCYVRLMLTSTDIATADMWNAVISQVMQGQDTTNWTWDVAADGSAVYAYYNSILNPSGTTVAAFSGFQFADTATEADIADIVGADGQLDLVVTAQAIQSDGFTAPTVLADYQTIFNGKTFIAN